MSEYRGYAARVRGNSDSHPVLAVRRLTQNPSGYIRRPATKASGNLRLHPVADGDNHVEVVVTNLTFYLPFPLGSN